MMNSITVTKRDHRKDTFTWEIEDLTLHFPFYEERPSPSIFGKLESPTFNTGEGTPLHSTWKLRVHSDYNQDRQNREARFQLCLEFMGYQSKTKPESRETVSCIYEVTVGQKPVSGVVCLPFFRIKRNGTFSAYRDSKLLLPHPGTSSVMDILPLIDLYTKRAEYCPQDALQISVTIVTLLEPVHVTRVFPILTSENEQNLTAMEGLDGCFRKLLKSERWSDLKIICGESTFFAHKLVLCAQSPVFCTMLETPMRESVTSEIVIEDMDPSILDLMLTFIYTGKIELPEEKEVLLQILDCAEKYELTKLKTCCFHKILSSITDQNVGDFAMAAYSYGADADTTAAIREYCIERHSRLLKNPSYKKLFLTTPSAFVGA